MQTKNTLPANTHFSFFGPRCTEMLSYPREPSALREAILADAISKQGTVHAFIQQHASTLRTQYSPEFWNEVFDEIQSRWSNHESAAGVNLAACIMMHHLCPGREILSVPCRETAMDTEEIDALPDFNLPAPR